MSFEMPERPFRPGVVVEARDLARRHAPLPDQVQDDAGIELARAGAHRQAVEGRKAHCRLDAAAACEGAHIEAPLPRCATTTRPAAMLWRDLGQPGRDVLVAEAVEAVTADALVVERARQRASNRRKADGVGGRRCRSRRPAAPRERSPSRGGLASNCSADAAARASGSAPSARGCRCRSAPDGRTRAPREPRGGQWPEAREAFGVASQARVSVIAAGRSGTSAG